MYIHKHQAQIRRSSFKFQAIASGLNNKDAHSNHFKSAFHLTDKQTVNTTSPLPESSVLQYWY